MRALKRNITLKPNWKPGIYSLSLALIRPLGLVLRQVWWKGQRDGWLVAEIVSKVQIEA